MKTKLQVQALLLVGPLCQLVAASRLGTQVLRRKYPPSTPSPKQLLTRKAFAAVDAAWGSLPMHLRQAWNAYQAWRKNYGYNRFQQVNIPRQLAGLPLILNPADIP